MNYKLALQLKNAGFPQMGDGFALVLHDEALFEDLSDQTMSVIPWCKYVYDPSKRTDVVYSPTLDELIEQCGAMFKILENMTGNRWDAISVDVLDTSGFQGTGSTPREAVANLYLALHGQNSKS